MQIDKQNIACLWMRSFLTNNPFYLNVLVLVKGISLAQLLAVLASPVLTRLYSPAEFGLLTVYISLLSVLGLLGTLQYENAILLPAEDDGAANLMVLSFAVLSGICILSTAFLLIGSQLLTDFLNAPGLTEFIWLIPISLLGMGTYNILNEWALRTKRFERIAQTKITQGVGMVGTMLAAGLMQMGILGLLLGDVVGRTGGSGRLMYLVLKEDWQIIKKATPQGILKAVFRFKGFPMLSAGSALLKEISEQMPALFFAYAFGPQVVGWFMLVQRILGMPLSLIGYSVGNVYMAEAALLKQKDKCKQVMSLYWRTLKHLTFISVPLVAAFTLLAPGIFDLVFGRQWSEAGDYFRILAPMYLLQFLSIPVSTTLYVFERQELQVLREVIRFGILLGSIMFIASGGLPPEKAMVFLAVSGSVGFLANGFISWLAIKQTMKHCTQIHN